MGFSDRHPLLALLLAMIIIGFAVVIGFAILGEALAGFDIFDIFRSWT